MSSGESGSVLETPTVQMEKSKGNPDMPAPVAFSTPTSAKKSDIQFEADMGNLNSRLATIVDRNNSIQGENKRLKHSLDMFHGQSTQELERVKKLYDDELGEARRLLDNEANKKVKMELDIQSFKAENKEFKEKSEQCSINEKTAQALAEQLQKKLDGQSAELAQLRRKSQNSQSEKDELTMQLSAAKSDLDRANKRAEESLLQKHQKENEIQSLREEFDMAKRVHQQELKCAKDSNEQSLRKTIHEQSLVANQSMSSALEEIRLEHEENLKATQKKIRQEFEKKIRDNTTRYEKQKKLMELKRDEASRSKALNDQLNAQLRRAEKDLSLARDELRKAEAQVASQRGLADATITELQEDNTHLRTKAGDLENTIITGKEKYSSLLKEVQTYRSLLEVEENRLNITPSPVRGDRKKRSRSQVGSVSNISPKKSKPSEEQLSELHSEVTRDTESDASCLIM